MIFLIGLGYSNSIYSEDNLSGSIRVISENDSYGIFTDRYYTSGNRIEYLSPDMFSVPGFLFQKFFSDKIQKNCDRYINYCTPLFTNGISANHLVFTPYEVGKYDPKSGDRPYAGLFYISNSYSAVLSGWIYYSEWKFGFTGTNTLAEKAQREIHRFFSLGEPSGWFHQVKGENGMNIDQKLIKPFNKNIAVYSNLGLGNIDLHNEWGLYLRWGKIASQNTFSGYSIRDPGSAGIYGSYPSESEDSEYFFFVYPGVKYQERNITLGNKISNSSDFRGVLSDPNFSERDRFLLFKYGLLQTNSTLAPQEELIVFNTVFNNLSTLEEKQARILVEYIYNTENVNPLTALAYYNLIFPNSGWEYSVTKYIAYKKFLEQSVIPASEHNTILALALLSGEFQHDKEYTTIPRKVQGFIQSGFAIKANAFFAAISWQLSSTEFYQIRAFPNHYLYGSIQLGYRF
jgi:hypothetical protein